MLHELSHLRSDGRALTAQVSEIAGPEDTGLCLTCEAFAQIAHSAPGFAPVIPPAPAAMPPAPDPLFSVIGASAPSPRSRGPPHT